MHLEEVDFRELSVAEAVEKLRSFGKPGLEPLVEWVANGYAYLHAVMGARDSFAHWEREAKRLWKPH